MAQSRRPRTALPVPVRKPWLLAALAPLLALLLAACGGNGGPQVDLGDLPVDDPGELVPLATSINLVEGDLPERFTDVNAAFGFAVAMARLPVAALRTIGLSPLGNGDGAVDQETGELVTVGIIIGRHANEPVDAVEAIPQQDGETLLAIVQPESLLIAAEALAPPELDAPAAAFRVRYRQRPEGAELTEGAEDIFVITDVVMVAVGFSLVYVTHTVQVGEDGPAPGQRPDYVRRFIERVVERVETESSALLEGTATDVNRS